MPALRASTAPLTRPLLILTALFLLSLPLVTTRLYASDEVQYFSYLRSLWFDRDVSFDNEYRHFYDTGVVHYPGFHETFLENVTPTGRRVTFATIGAAILWSPFYAVADVVVRARIAMGGTIEADGYSQPYITAVAYGSAAYGWLSLVLSMLIVRRVLSGHGDRGTVAWLSLAAALAVWIGTPLFFYMYIAPPMSHACSAFAVAIFVLTWLRVRGRWSAGGMALLGALAALAAMVREQELLIVIGPAIDWLWTMTRAARGRSSPVRIPVVRPALNALAGAAAFAIAYTPQLAAYNALHGYPGPSRLVTRKMYWTAPHALQVLLSPQHGMLFWTPLLALALIGLGLLAFRSRRSARSDSHADAAHIDASPADTRQIGICLLLIVAAQVYVAGSVESWTVAGAFGQRRFVGLTAIFVVGVAVFLRWLSPVPSPAAMTSMPSSSRPSRLPQRAGVVIVAIAIWWNLGLMAQFGAGLMDRQRLELGRNAYHTFVTIPLRLPELVRRYVFERRTFFKPPSAAAGEAGATEGANGAGANGIGANGTGANGTGTIAPGRTPP